MHQYNPKLNRFNKPSKELLVEYINFKNNRGLRSDQLIFGKPVLKDESGLSETEISFDPSTGWPTDQTRTFAFFRVDLESMLRGKPLVVHVDEDGDDALLAAIRAQYGLLIEKDLVTIEVVTKSFADNTQNTTVAGFDPEDAPEVEPEEPPPPAYLDNRNYRITFSDDHLIFFGGFDVFTRRSLEMLGGNIDSLLDLREFYCDGNFDLPKADLIYPHGELYIGNEIYPDYTDRKAVASYLYGTKAGTLISQVSRLPEILLALTGDAWVVEDAGGVDFNLHGSEILYNGLVKADQPLQDGAYNYVLAIQLGHRCANLAGVIKIGYQFASSRVPGNITQNLASVLPLFPR